MPVDSPSALGVFRVLDLSGPMGQPCARYLADLGADVIKVEPPGGDPARRMAPFVGGEPHPEKSIYFLYFNTNKRSVVLDLERPQDRARLVVLAQASDVLVESFAPGYLASLSLGYEELQRLNPGLVMTSITPFGQTGPYRHFKGNDFTAEAIGGSILREGEPGGTPFTRPHYQAYQMAGLHAAYGTLLALYDRRRTGLGQQVDVSLQEVVAHQDFTLVTYASYQEIYQRTGHRSSGRVTNCFPCSDGWVHMSTSFQAQWQALGEWSQDPVLRDPQYLLDDQARRRDVELIDEHISAFTRQWTRDAYIAEATQRRLPVAPLHSVAEFVEHPDTKARAFFVETGHPVLGPHHAPGAPVRYSRTPWRIRRPAPLLGEHTAEVLASLDRLRGQAPAPASSRDGGDGGRLPLDGIRVVDLSRVWSGPYGTRFLGDFGAEVIKVESTKFVDGRVLNREPNPDAWRRSNTMYAEINRNKLSATVDLHTEEGRALLKRLIATSDVVVENYHPATMPRWGLCYVVLKAVKPDIIMVSCPGYGNYGPSRELFAFGGCLSSYIGMAHLWGFPGAPPNARSKYALPDYLTAATLAVAVMAALHHRERTGEGQFIELVQAEAAACMIGTAYLEYLLNGVEPEPQGNQDPNAAPQGVYRCKGNDRWCAISCTSEEEWQALVRLMGTPGLAEDPRFSTLASRQAHHDLLDQSIAEWTQQFTPHQVMFTCQQVGIPAAVAASGEDLYRDPHLRERGYVLEVEHPVPGRLEHPGMTVRLSRTPGQIRHPAPTIGQHNDYVYGQILGIQAMERKRLIDDGVLV
ncbi:MAG: CoA transferase [Chloroflexi bacterium]|nr:CoA transferase [Chloroflexota bacterium]